MHIQTKWFWHTFEVFVRKSLGPTQVFHQSVFGTRCNNTQGGHTNISIMSITRPRHEFSHSNEIILLFIPKSRRIGLVICETHEKCLKWKCTWTNRAWQWVKALSGKFAGIKSAAHPNEFFLHNFENFRKKTLGPCPSVTDSAHAVIMHPGLHIHIYDVHLQAQSWFFTYKRNRFAHHSEISQNWALIRPGGSGKSFITCKLKKI